MLVFATTANVGPCYRQLTDDSLSVCFAKLGTGRRGLFARTSSGDACTNSIHSRVASAPRIAAGSPRGEFEGDHQGRIVCRRLLAVMVPWATSAASSDSSDRVDI